MGWLDARTIGQHIEADQRQSERGISGRYPWRHQFERVTERQLRERCFRAVAFETDEALACIELTLGPVQRCLHLTVRRSVADVLSEPEFAFRMRSREDTVEKGFRRGSV